MNRLNPTLTTKMEDFCVESVLTNTQLRNVFQKAANSNCESDFMSLFGVSGCTYSENN